MAKLFRCPDCEKELPKESFYTNRHRSTGRSAHCKKCHSAMAVRTRCPEKARIYMREYNLINKYGINTEQFDAMLASQGGGCKICTDPEDLVVDHDHDTNEVRGILCRRCNCGIGYFKESTLIIQAALGYLKGEHYR